MGIRLPISLTHIAKMDAEVVSVDIQLIFALDVFRKLTIILDFGGHALKSKCDVSTFIITQYSKNA